MAYENFAAKDIESYMGRIEDMRRNMDEILHVVRSMGPEAKITVQLSSLNTYLPRLEITILNAVAKAKSDLIQHRYQQPYPERNLKTAKSTQTGEGTKRKKP